MVCEALDDRENEQLHSWLLDMRFLTISCLIGLALGEEPPTTLVNGEGDGAGGGFNTIDGGAISHVRPSRVLARSGGVQVCRGDGVLGGKDGDGNS